MQNDATETFGPQILDRITNNEAEIAAINNQIKAAQLFRRCSLHLIIQTRLIFHGY